MNHYMSYTGLSSAGTSTNDRTKGKLYQANDRASLRRMKRHRRSTRSLANNRSKANSMGNLVTMRDRSGGSLRSVHRKSTTSLLLNDTIDYNNTTIGSRRSGDSGHNYHHHQQLPQQSHRSSQRNLTLLNTSSGSNYQSLPPPPPPDNNIYQTHHQQQQHHHQMSGPPLPPPPNYHYHNNQGYNNNHNHQQSQQTQQHQQQQQQQPSHGTPGARYSTASSSYQVIGSINGNRGRYLPSDSDTEFYHTFTTHPGMVNPLYGNRNSYLNDSETAIWLFVQPLFAFWASVTSSGPGEISDLCPLCLSRLNHLNCIHIFFANPLDYNVHRLIFHFIFYTHTFYYLFIFALSSHLISLLSLLLAFNLLQTRIRKLYFSYFILSQLNKFSFLSASASCRQATCLSS